MLLLPSAASAFYKAPKQRLTCKPQLQELNDETGDEQEITSRLHGGCNPPPKSCAGKNFQLYKPNVALQPMAIQILRNQAQAPSINKDSSWPTYLPSIHFRQGDTNQKQH